MKKSLSEEEMQHLMRGLRTNTTIQTVDISSTVPLKDKMCHYISTCFGFAQKETKTPAIGAMKNMKQDWNDNQNSNRKIKVIADWNSIDDLTNTC